MASIAHRTGLPTDYIDIADHHEALDRLKLLNRGNGFGIVIQRTKQDSSAQKAARKVFLQCLRSRIYKPSTRGLRKGTSKSTECPWRACMTRAGSGWDVQVLVQEHNHELDHQEKDDEEDAPAPPRRQKPTQAVSMPVGFNPYPMPAYSQPPAAPVTAPVPPSQRNHYAPPHTQYPQYLPYPPQQQQQQQQQLQHAAQSQHPQAPQALQPHSQFPNFSQFTVNTLNPPPSRPNPPPPVPGTAPPGSPAYRVAETRMTPAVTGRAARSSKPVSNDAELPSTLRRRGRDQITIKKVKVSVEQRLVASSRNSNLADPPAFLIYDDEFEAIIGEKPNIMIAFEDNVPFAHDACVYSPQQDAVFVTSNHLIPKGKFDRATVISKLTRKTNGDWTRKELITPMAMPAGGINYNDGIVFCTQGDYREIGGLVHMQTEHPFKTKVILNNYLGRRFNSLSDVAVHSDNTLWFTDNIYGYEMGTRPKPELPNQVYVCDPQAGTVRVAADGFGRPNGLAFSPDERSIYITDTDYIHGDGSRDPTRTAAIYAYDIYEMNNVKWLLNRRVFATPDNGAPDGIKCDCAGNVYAACGDGINVWDASGSLLGKILIPGGTSNFCFARSGEMFLLSENRFWVVYISKNVRGALLDRMGIEVDVVGQEDANMESDDSLFNEA